MIERVLEIKKTRGCAVLQLESGVLRVPLSLLRERPVRAGEVLDTQAYRLFIAQRGYTHALDHAVRLLSLCDRSENEVRRRLLDSGYPAACVDRVIEKLYEAELLDGSDELKILTADFEFAADEAPAPDYPCTNTNAVNLRKGPAKSEEKLAQLADGTHVDVIEAVTNAAGEVWLKVTAGGKTGYVMAGLVDGYSAPAGEDKQEEPVQEERQIRVSASYDTDELQLGSRITLTAKLEGYDGQSYTCCWQYAAADKEGNIIGEWQNAQSSALSYSYTLSEENLLTAWRMCVTISE